MHPEIIVGNVVRPTDEQCSLLPTACRIILVHEKDVWLIPVFWDETKTDPPGPLVLTATDLSTEIRSQVSVVSRPSFKTFNREPPSQEEAEKAEKLKVAFAEILRPKELARAIREPNHRASLLRKVAGISESTARRFLHLYLIYNFSDKVFARYRRTKKTRSPKQKSEVKRGKSSGGPALPVVRTALANGVRKFYAKKNMTEARSFVCTIREYYPDKTEPITLADGRPWFRVKRGFEHQIPTKNQYRYVIELLRAAGELKRERPNLRRKAPKKRAKKGSARQFVDLAGQVFQSDATRLQVRVVQKWKRSEILQGITLYTAIDVCTTAITGWRLSPNYPSTAEALQLLKQCASDKREQVENLGVEYFPGEWVVGLPANLHADRGEWVSNKAHTISVAGIAIKVNEPYAPENKGAIERTHDLIKEKLSREGIPGTYRREAQRGEANGFEAACLTLDEIEMRVVGIIREINLQPPPVEVIPTGMIAEGIEQVSRIDVWNWRRKNEPGAIRVLDEKQIYESFLTPLTGSVNSVGIRYNTRDYVSAVLHDYGLTTKSLKRGNDNKIRVFMDEHLPHILKFEHPETGELVDARCEEEYLEQLNLRYWEAELYRAHREALAGATSFSGDVVGIEQEKRFQKVVNNAKQETAADLSETGITTNGRKTGRRAATQKARTVQMINYEQSQTEKGNVSADPSKTTASADGPPTVPAVDPFAPRPSTNSL